MARLVRRLGGGSVLGLGGAGAALLGYDLAWQGECEDRGARSGAKGSTALVIGGGIAGVTTAYFLGRSGFKVTILEQGEGVAPPCSASSLNAGWCRAACNRPATSVANLEAAAKSAVSPEGTYTISVKPLQFLRDVQWIRFGLRYTAASLLNSVQQSTEVSFEQLSAFSGEMTRKVAADEQFGSDEWSFIPGSIAKICVTPAGFAGAKRDAEEFTSNGFRVSVLDQEQAQAAMGGAAFQKDLVGIVHEHDGFSADGGRFVQRLRKTCADKFGCEFRTSTRAVALHADGKRVTGVEAADGQVFSADAIVLANGAWAPALAQTAKVWLPMVPMRGYSLEVPASAPRSEALESQLRRFPNQIFPHCLVTLTAFADKADAPRRIRFTSVAEFMPADAPPSPPMVQYLQGHATTLYPELASVLERSEVRVGSRPQTPDDLPIVSGTRYSNLFVNVGGCSYGWRFGCGMSAMLATLVTDERPLGTNMPDVRQFSLGRFQWGPFLDRARLSPDLEVSAA